MQMRLASIPGTADVCQQLASPHAIPYLHAQTSWLQMHVISELAATEVQRNRHSWVKRFAVSRDVIWQTISCCHYAAVGYGQHRFAVGIIRVHVPCIARE